MDVDKASGGDGGILNVDKEGNKDKGYHTNESPGIMVRDKEGGNHGIILNNCLNIQNSKRRRAKGGVGMGCNRPKDLEVGDANKGSKNVSTTSSVG